MTNEMRARELLADQYEKVGLLQYAPYIRKNGGGPLDAVTAALRAIEAALSLFAAQDGWQSIDTAPRDGDTEFLAWGCPDGVSIMQVVYYEPSQAPDITTVGGHVYKGEEWCWAVLDGSTRHKNTFTHWQPLPATPERWASDLAHIREA